MKHLYDRLVQMEQEAVCRHDYVLAQICREIRAEWLERDGGVMMFTASAAMEVAV
jgi:hypothetical protein